MRKFYILFLFVGVAFQGLQAQTCTNAASAGSCTGANVAENFNSNSGTFTSTNFTYSGANGRYEVAGVRATTYTIRSGIYTLQSTTGAIGFSTTGSVASVQNVTVRILDATTNAVLFTCTQTQNNFISAGQVCVQYTGMTAFTQVRFEILVTTANGNPGDGLVVFDNFSNGGSAFALPVKLDNFDASNEAAGIKLSWTSSEETGVARYEIQRSVNGVNFQTIAAVNAEAKRTYTYVDALPTSTSNFYRLRIVDLDNSVRISHIVSVKSKVGKNIEVYPNPVRSTMVVQHPKAISGSRLQVVNLTGQVLKDLQIAPNTVVTSLDLTGMSNGSYYIIFRSGSENYTQRITKQ